MRVRLKGLHSATKKLADGRRVTYYYAWRGGPRIEGEAGSPEFVAAYNEAVSRKIAPPAGVLSSLTRYYETTSAFKDLSDCSKEDYREKIALIERKFGDLPLAALDDRRTRGLFLEWRDLLADSSKRQADYAWTVLARVLSVAKHRGKISTNPCEKGGRLYRGSRRDMVWSREDEEAFLAVAPTHMRLPLLLALWTGQRQGDLLRLTWSAYDGRCIRLRQSKTKARVTIPVGKPLKTALDAAKKVRQGVRILTTLEGMPWTADGFRSSWRKACTKAGIEGLTFHDLRGTAVTRLAMAGATEAEIAVFTGHSLADVREILDKHYLNRDSGLAESAVKKLERRAKREQKLQTGLQTGPVVPGQKTAKAQ